MLARLHSHLESREESTSKFLEDRIIGRIHFLVAVKLMEYNFFKASSREKESLLLEASESKEVIGHLLKDSPD